MSGVRTFIGVNEMPVFGKVLKLPGDCPVSVQPAARWKLPFLRGAEAAPDIAHPAGLIDVVSAARRVSGSMS